MISFILELLQKSPSYETITEVDSFVRYSSNLAQETIPSAVEPPTDTSFQKLNTSKTGESLLEDLKDIQSKTYVLTNDALYLYDPKADKNKLQLMTTEAQALQNLRMKQDKENLSQMELNEIQSQITAAKNRQAAAPSFLQPMPSHTPPSTSQSITHRVQAQAAIEQKEQGKINQIFSNYDRKFKTDADNYPPGFGKCTIDEKSGGINMKFPSQDKAVDFFMEQAKESDFTLKVGDQVVAVAKDGQLYHPPGPDGSLVQFKSNDSFLSSNTAPKDSPQSAQQEGQRNSETEHEEAQSTRPGM
ncbi:Uncharacterised protein (plasmid) [Legionella adelaidensis]|uniref:Uncharacterized protein n=1 Tax=Legionella adelaidensis TaxID=45056 RepID=A0A0W0R5B8_9GAMM|nr:hypothetical protein [Legionella adelaidensis]KTC66278.1 hypothetical protein Lade_0936 [Legionella adelaidensis]VEH84874.1 Uncharacterised protein [Legionella adelaidensis]